MAPKNLPEGENEPTSEPPETQEGTGISKADYDRAQAELRRAKAALAKRDQEDAQRLAKEAQERAAAEGNYAEATRLEQRLREDAEARAQQLAVRDALRDLISDRGLAGDRARAALNLTNLAGVAVDEAGEPDAEQLKAALERTVEQYPGVFQATPAPAADPEPAPGRRPPRTPATPPKGGKMPEGYVSPEEYVETPSEVRISKEFQRRVALSRPHWPKQVPANTFALGQG